MQTTDNSAQAKRAAPRGTALDPKNPSLVQPFKRLVDEGFITELTVKFTPTGTTTVGKPDERMAGVKDSGLTAGKDAPLGILAAVADQGNLIPLKGKKSGKKIEQPLPERSLDKKDFAGTAAELLARCTAVANNCGGATLVGRVRSANHFDGTTTTSFQNWWAQAKPYSRCVALSTEKKRADMTKDEIMKLGTLPCPFRGTQEFIVANEEAPAKPSSPSKTGGKE
jgi:hypothetical protein